MTHKVGDDSIAVRINQYTLFWGTVQLSSLKFFFKCTYTDSENLLLEVYPLDIVKHFLYKFIIEGFL